MKKIPLFKLIVARLVDYAIWLGVLSVIEDQTSLYLSPFLVLILAPAMALVFGTLSARYFKTTLGFKLLGIEIVPPVSCKQAFLTTLPWYRSEPFNLKYKVPKWRYVLAFCISALSLFLQINDPVYGFNSKSAMVNSSWVQYTHEEKGFSVFFPDEPEEAKVPLTPTGDSGLNYTEMSVQEKKGVYSLSYLKMPKKWGLAGENTILKVAMDLIVKNTEGAVLKERHMTNYQGIKAIDYVLQIGSKEVTGRLLIHNNTLYKLHVEYPQAFASKIPKDEFLASFAIQS